MVLRGSPIPRLWAPGDEDKRSMAWLKKVRICHEKVVILGQFQPSPVSVSHLDEVLH